MRRGFLDAAAVAVLVVRAHHQLPADIGHVVLRVRFFVQIKPKFRSVAEFIRRLEFPASDFFHLDRVFVRERLTFTLGD